MVVPGLDGSLSPLALNDDEQQIVNDLETDDSFRELAAKSDSPLVQNVGFPRAFFS
jgi:hypothetical protein